MKRGSRVEALAENLQWTGSGPQRLNWSDVENDIGHAFPEGFKALTSRFPSGSIGEFVRLFSPVQSEHYFDAFKEERSLALDSYRMMRAYFPLPYSLYPETDGISPWAAGDNEYYFWKVLPESDPEQWPIVYMDAHATRYGEYNGTVSEFLCDILVGLVSDAGFPLEPGTKDWQFDPFDDV